MEYFNTDLYGYDSGMTTISDTSTAEITAENSQVASFITRTTAKILLSTHDVSLATFETSFSTSMTTPTTGVDGGVSTAGDRGRDCLVYKFLVDTVLLAGLCLFGLVGNGLTCWVMWRDRNSSPTSFLLIVLSLVNDCVLVTMFNQKAFLAGFRLTGHTQEYFYYYPYIEAYGWALVSTAHMTATWIVVLITSHRFISVCLPHMSKLNTVAKARRNVVIVVIICIISTLPRYFDNTVIYSPKTGGPKRITAPFARHPGYIYSYRISFYYVMIYALPMTFLAIFTFRLIRNLRQLNKRREEMTTKSRARADTTFSLVIVVIVFILCQLVNPIRRLMAQVIPSRYLGCGHFYYYFSSLNTAFVMASAASVLPVFVLCGKGFRQRLLRKLFYRNRVETTASSGGANPTANTGWSCRVVGSQSEKKTAFLRNP